MKEKLDRQERKKEREPNFELEKLKLQHTREHSSIKAEFNAATNITLIPKFKEKTVDKYFSFIFEKRSKKSEMATEGLVNYVTKFTYWQSS